MISAAERRARIEKLKKDREDKEKERQALAAQSAAQKTSIASQNTLISTILTNTAEANKKLDAQAAGMTPEQAIAAQQAQRLKKRELKVCNFVMEIEVRPKAKPLTYDKEITCDIIDAAKAQRLARIDENEIGEEDWEQDFNDRFESVQQEMKAGRNVAPRRSSHHHRDKVSNKINTKE